jgi:hypothetical protein
MFGCDNEDQVSWSIHTRLTGSAVLISAGDATSRSGTRATLQVYVSSTTSSWSSAKLDRAGWPPRSQRHGHAVGPALSRDPRAAAPPLRVALRRSGAARREPRRGHARHLPVAVVDQALRAHLRFKTKSKSGPAQVGLTDAAPWFGSGLMVAPYRASRFKMTAP